MGLLFQMSMVSIASDIWLFLKGSYTSMMIAFLVVATPDIYTVGISCQFFQSAFMQDAFLRLGIHKNSITYLRLKISKSFKIFVDIVGIWLGLFDNNRRELINTG